MKNKISVIVFVLIFLLFMFMPIIVSSFDSEPTDKFLSLINIEEDGSIRVRELIKLNGEYNGLERELTLSNGNSSEATYTSKDIEGNNSLYDGSTITDVKVGSINDDGDLSFDDFNKSITYFDNDSLASNGDSHLYTLWGNYSDTHLKLYNPDSLDEVFYIEYTVLDTVVVHEDIAELAYNVLGDGYKENIGEFDVKVILPNSDNDYRVWLHGPLNGNIDRTNNREALGTFNFLGAYNPVSVRLIFNKNLVPYASKYSGLTAKDAIISYQTKLSDEANKEREAIKNANMTLIIISVIWVIVSLTLALIIYLKERKSKKTDFNMEYFRDFPGDYGPEVLEYLLDKKVTEKSLSATILNLIYKKVLKVEKIEGKKKEDYKLILQDYDESQLTETEKIALKLIINEVGNSKEVVLSTIKKHCSNVSNARSFMELYNDFIRESKCLGKEKNFYSNTPFILFIASIVYFLGIILVFIGFSFELVYLSIILIVLIIALFIFIFTRKFFTKIGAEHYAKWMAHKKFLEDFSRFDEKELPEVILWDKYLVYAVILGNADKLSKEMKIKVDAMNTNDGTTIYMGYDPFFTHYMITSSVYSSINNSVHTAVSSSRSSIAASQTSSGGGFGGGSIGGGGSFGGGGGGGRF